METTKGWCKWYVSVEYITSALKQLEDNKVDMTKVFIVPYSLLEPRADYIIIYKNE